MSALTVLRSFLLLRHISADHSHGSVQFSSEEIAALEQKRDALQTAMKIQAKERGIARVNSHTTVEANRVIQTIEDSTRDSKEFFRNVGGSGSSTDLRTQAQILATRAKEKAKEEKAEARAKAKAQKELAAAEAKAHKKQERIAANSKCTVQPKSKPGCKRKRSTGEPFFSALLR